MRSNTAKRVEKHRRRLREAGLRPIQIWIPDTRKKGFAEECKRQSKLIRRDPQEKEILNIISSLTDYNEWVE